MFIIQTILEFSVAGFIIWGLFNESKLVDFEDKIILKIKNKIAQKKRSNFYDTLHPKLSKKWLMPVDLFYCLNI